LPQAGIGWLSGHVLSFAGDNSYKHSLITGGYMAKKSKRRAWTSEQVRTLKALAKKKRRAAIIARTLKRTEGATRQKAFSIGLSLDSRAWNLARLWAQSLHRRLEAAHVVTTIYEATGIRPTFDGRNGDAYTGGEIKIAVLVAGCSQRGATVLH
jgi:hypothetical protein